MSPTRTLITAAVALLVTGQLAAAQPPTLTNARVTKHAAAGALEPQVTGLVTAASEPAWIGWAVPANNPDDNNCCWNSTNGVTRYGCQLEDGGGAQTTGPAAGPKKIDLESGRLLVVLVRAENKAIQKVAAYSDACELDAGGRPVAWIDGVKPADSIALLSRLAVEVGQDGKIHQPASGAMLALALHADESAVRALISLAESAQASHVRSQALFWLAQRAGQKAAAAIVNAIQNDPDTAVKKQAVFALSQLPKDEGVPKLIDVARTNRNGEVRKQAIFWLGQSKDPRALAFFRDILLK